MGAEVYPWEKLEHIFLDSGVELWVRSVPPYAAQDVHAKFPPPPRPKVTLIGADGHEEIKPALPGSPEFEEYTDKLNQHKRDNISALTNFNLDYAVVKWRYPGEEEGKFHTKPPKGWVPPSMFEGYDVKYKATDRVSFIKLALIQTVGDQDRVEEIMIGTPPISLDDIKAALVPTDSPETESL